MKILIFFPLKISFGNTLEFLAYWRVGQIFDNVHVYFPVNLFVLKPWQCKIIVIFQVYAGPQSAAKFSALKGIEVFLH